MCYFLKNTHLINYCQPVCYFLKNTTIPYKEYLQYPVNTTYKRVGLGTPHMLQELCATGKSKKMLNKPREIKIGQPSRSRSSHGCAPAMNIIFMPLFSVFY